MKFALYRRIVVTGLSVFFLFNCSPYRLFQYSPDPVAANHEQIRNTHGYVLNAKMWWDHCPEPYQVDYLEFWS